MSLFKKIDCAVCGKQTNVISRIKLSDGNYICTECSLIVPTYMHKTLFLDYSLDDFLKLKEYIAYSNEKLRPVFEENESYYTVHMDTINDIFYLGKRIDDRTIFFEFSNVSNFDVVFNPEEFKEGLLSDKVKGEILFALSMNLPRFEHEEKLATNVKASAKKKLFGTKIAFENPDGMDDFIAQFQVAWLLSQEEVDADIGGSATPNTELQQAMSLFMFDSLDDLTIEDLKLQRNRLMKVFHPDVANEGDTHFAQKINKAYDVLKAYIS